MKNPIEMLKEIKNLLGVELSEEVKDEPQIVLAQLKLDNGTVIEANDFVEGSDVFILTEDERVALPKGEYQLEDGRTLEIINDGVINSVEVKAEEEPEEKEDDEKEMKEQEFVSKDEFDALKEMVMSMKEKMGAYDDKKKMDEEAELKEELSKPAAQPIKHSPEAPQKKKVLYSQNRGATTLDVVMNKIYNKQ
jgi:hypothetical protein|tara:strand:+ start:260 stop:838 length:579 start_codon:yes stop_codon:yes gene_type:complete